MESNLVCNSWRWQQVRRLPGQFNEIAIDLVIENNFWETKKNEASATEENFVSSDIAPLMPVNTTEIRMQVPEIIFKLYWQSS